MTACYCCAAWGEGSCTSRTRARDSYTGGSARGARRPTGRTGCLFLEARPGTVLVRRRAHARDTAARLRGCDGARRGAEGARNASGTHVLHVRCRHVTLRERTAACCPALRCTPAPARMQRAALGGARRGAAPAGAAEMRGGGRRGAAHARQSPAGGGPRRQRKPKNTVRGGRGRPRRGARGRHAGAGAGQGGATAPLALAGHGGAGQEGERLEGGRSPLFGLRFAAPLLAPAAAVASAWGAAPHCLVPALVFVAVPLLDVALGEDRSPPAGGAGAAAEVSAVWQAQAASGCTAWQCMRLRLRRRCSSA